MSSNMFENERWQLIDHYISMIQNLNTQSQQIYTTQNEAYVKLSELMQTARTPQVPTWTRIRPPSINHASSRINTHRVNTSMSSRRRLRDPETNRQGEPNEPSHSSHSRGVNSRPHPEPTSGESSRNVTEEQGVDLDEERTRQRMSRTPPIPPPTPRVRTTPTERLTSEMGSNFLFGPSVIGTLGSLGTPSNTSTIPINSNISPFNNIVREFQWTQPQEHTYPFNFMNNVPVFPTSEEISAATRIIRFDTVENPKNTRCPITLVPFNPSDTVIQVVHCGHIFDIVYLNGWFRDNVRCPVCRHDIRETDVGDDSHSTLAPDEFIDNGNETDPDMPELLSPNETLSHDTPSEEHAPPVRNLHILEEDTLHGFAGSGNQPAFDGSGNQPAFDGSINITPLWGFTQSTSSTSGTDSGDQIPRIFSDIQNAIATQGIDMLSSVINQTIRETFPPPPNTSQTTPEPMNPAPTNPDNNDAPNGSS